MRRNAFNGRTEIRIEWTTAFHRFAGNYWVTVRYGKTGSCALLNAWTSQVSQKSGSKVLCVSLTLDTGSQVGYLLRVSGTAMSISYYCSSCSSLLLRYGAATQTHWQGIRGGRLHWSVNNHRTKPAPLPQLHWRLLRPCGGVWNRYGLWRCMCANSVHEMDIQV